MARAAKVPKVKRMHRVSCERTPDRRNVYWAGFGAFWKRSDAMRASVALDILSAIERGELIVK